MFYYNLLDNDKKKVLTNLPEGLNKNAEICKCLTELVYFNGQKCRQGKITDDNIGEVFLLTNDTDEVNSTRMFKDKINLYLNFIKEIKDIKEDLINSILHDITKINGYCIQELYEIIPENIIKGATYDKQISLLESYIVQNKRNVAKGLFKINRDVLHLKTECSNLKYLYSKKIQIEKKYHNISKAIMPSLHVYMPHLSKKGVTVNIKKEEEKEINLNFEYFDSALVPLFDNITKYILPDSELLIYFGKTVGGFGINFDMISMAIKKSELGKIFDNGYSGINAVRNKVNGNGIGLARIQDSLFINNAELRVNININKKTEKRYKTTDYERNVFQIVFLD